MRAYLRGIGGRRVFIARLVSAVCFSAAEWLHGGHLVVLVSWSMVALVLSLHYASWRRGGRR